jgi:hypothetical protein
LLYNLFQPVPSNPPGSVVIAFTSAMAGEGVSHVVRSLLQASHRNLAPTGDANAVRIQQFSLRNSAFLHTLQSGSNDWSGSWEQRGILLQNLRAQYKYVAIDCPALSESGDVLSIAKLVDGIVLIVEADKTRKSQVRNAERQIETAGGKLLGSVLNKRRYPIPNFIYDRL